MWGATTTQYSGYMQGRYFNPRTPCGVRLRVPPKLWDFRNFNPRTPCGVRPGCAVALPGPPGHFNPRTPCGVRRSNMVASLAGLGISIHAPRVGCDAQDFPFLLGSDVFQSTHPVWGATRRRYATGCTLTFQSTHPVWGATVSRMMCSGDSSTFQSTHPVWGATVAYG